MTKEDVVAAVEAKKSAPAAAAKPAAPAAAAPIFAEGDRVEKRVPMTRLRARSPSVWSKPSPPWPC